MDRQIVYIGQVPMDTDILDTNLDSYIGISKIAAGILGTSTQLNGLACTQTASPSMAVLVAAGEIYQLAAIDTSAYGSLPTNSTQILKQGINLTSTTTATMTAPVTVGQSVNNLIQFQLTEVDGGSQVLPYYDSANPSQAFAGPNNDAQPNYTTRQDQVGVSVKLGTPAATGTQTTPTPDAGYVGGWVVTIAHGDTTIVNGAISLYPNAPFIPSTLGSAATQVGVQAETYTYAASSTAANTYTATLTPVPTSYVTGMRASIKFTNHNTGAATINLNSLGAKSIVTSSGAALTAGSIQDGMIADLRYDGTNFQLLDKVLLYDLQNETVVYAASTTAANTYTASISPTPFTYTTGMRVSIKFSNHNTGASTINLNSMGAKDIKRVDGGSLSINDILDGMIADLRYDGTNFQLLNKYQGTSVQDEEYVYAASTTAANTYTASLQPTPPSYLTGMRSSIKFTNANTGAATINLNSLGAKSIKLLDGRDPYAGAIAAGMIADLRYDGTNFQLLNPAAKARTVQTFLTGSGTYTTPTGALYLRVRMAGGGGGSGGTGTGSPTGGGAGGTSTFGSAFLTCTGGSGGNAGSTSTSIGGQGGAGGAIATGGDINFKGCDGSPGGFKATPVYNCLGGIGGGSVLFGGGMGVNSNNAATIANAPPANSGGGAPGTTGDSNKTGSGGGGGASCLEKIVTAPSTTYAYAVGAGGTQGGGSSGDNGQQGAAGIIVVEEYYN